MAELDGAGTARRCGAVALAAASLAAGLFAAGHHPLWPLAASLAFLAWVVAAAWRPSLALVVLPAALPLLNFSPWTGWLLIDEFDLLALATIAAVHARAAIRPAHNGSPRRGWPGSWLVAALVLVCASALYRGVADAGPPLSGGWYAGYTSPLNSLRIAKSIAFALLLLPLWRGEMRASAPQALRRLRAGVLAGLWVVVLAVLWERAAFPGLTDFSAPYRTVALFWEMHVGGAAIDAYLAMATPFVAWALHDARSPARWGALALLALLTGYAGLTTFSRGVYLALGMPLLLLALWLWQGHGDAAGRRVLLRRAARAAALVLLTIAATTALVVGLAALGIGTGWGIALCLVAALGLALRHARHGGAWRSLGGRTLAALLALEVIAVLASGSFMTTRIAASDHDLASRVTHWRNGIGLLHGPAEWLLGLGWGRLPAHYARFVAGREFSGEAHPIRLADGQAAARLAGPKTLRSLAGQYSLTQRVALQHPGPYRVRFDARAETPLTLAVSVCEMHLLYERRCQSALTRIGRGGGPWQHVDLRLEGPLPSAGSAFMPRGGVFALSVQSAGASVDLAHVELLAADASALLHNGDFAQGFAGWFPAAQEYFIPWHIDNLYVEWLVDTGLSGSLVFLLLLAGALRRLRAAAAGREAAAPFLAASLCGALLVGGVSSIMDMPRVAFLLFMIIIFTGLPGGDRVPEQPAA